MFERLIIVGGGVMGSGIAQVAAEAGVKNVVVADKAFGASPGFLKYVQDKIKHGIFVTKDSQGKFIHRTREEVDEVYKRIEWCNTGFKQFKAYLLQTTMVVEAIEENIDLKQELYKTIEHYLPMPAPIFTNTSVISIKKLSECLIHPERFMGVHFFNPVPLMKPVEFITHPETSVGTFKAAKELIMRLGKIHKRAPDIPGFIANRLFVKEIEAFLDALEEGADFRQIDKAFTTGTWFSDHVAGKIVDRFLGAARDLVAKDRAHELLGENEEEFKKNVDELMRLGGALKMGPYELIGYADKNEDPKMQFRMGPARFIDHVGIDVAQNCCEMLLAQEPERWKTSPLLQKMLSEGKKGVKSGEGFYEYADKVTFVIALDKSYARIGWTGKVLSLKLVRELGEAFDKAKDLGAESVILDINRGRGADINEFLLALLDEDAAIQAINIWQSTILKVINYPGPVFAAIKGSAFGGAYEFALACDYIIAENDAEIGLVEAQRGMLPGGGGTQTLTRRVGESRARQMILRGAKLKRHNEEKFAKKSMRMKDTTPILADEVGPPWVDEAVDKITEERLMELVVNNKNIKKRGRSPLKSSIVLDFLESGREKKEIRKIRESWGPLEPESFELARNAIWYGNRKQIAEGIREDEFEAIVAAFKTSTALKKIIEFFEPKEKE
ncbi:MAG: 3-hydroxyacyl-CoA dehydrogenase (Hbd-2) [Parcubacteria group bacterium GW2011_GWA2_44_13]|nr:MAG: 3-hydroxyacyl-CoA dehydrogenase (Hbd-2) [Parcubacteria group bacterium GW2011_GWA2_44_13]